MSVNTQILILFPSSLILPDYPPLKHQSVRWWCVIFDWCTILGNIIVWLIFFLFLLFLFLFLILLDVVVVVLLAVINGSFSYFFFYYENIEYAKQIPESGWAHYRIIQVDAKNEIKIETFLVMRDSSDFLYCCFSQMYLLVFCFVRLNIWRCFFFLFNFLRHPFSWRNSIRWGLDLSFPKMANHLAVRKPLSDFTFY